MGIEQIVLRLPASRLREVNRVLEDPAWGAYRTECYPTDDYKAIALGERERGTKWGHVVAPTQGAESGPNQPVPIPAKSRRITFSSSTAGPRPVDFSQMHHKSFVR